jgi:hypothetical protein
MDSLPRRRAAASPGRKARRPAPAPQACPTCGVELVAGLFGVHCPRCPLAIELPPDCRPIPYALTPGKEVPHAQA